MIREAVTAQQKVLNHCALKFLIKTNEQLYGKCQLKRGFYREIKKVVTMEENNIYNIGDVVLMRGPRWREIEHEVKTQDKFKNTLLYKFLTTTRSQNVGTRLENLSDVLNTMLDNDHGGNDVLRVHLRLGDLVAIPARLRETLRCARNFALLLQSCPSHVKKIELICVFQYGPNPVTGKYYKNSTSQSQSFVILSNFLLQSLEANLEVELVSSCNPDKNFLMLAGASHLAHTGSAYAVLASHCAERLKSRSIDLRSDSIWRGPNI